MNLLFKLANGFLRTTNIYRIKGFRNFFWEKRAADIDRKWGISTEDYKTINAIIAKTQAQRILDFGCGSGRLFPLFESLKIREVVGVDISSKGIGIAKQKYPGITYALYSGEVESLNYPEKYFDLVISNRSLSAIPPSNLPGVINKLGKLGKYIYLNEFSKIEKEDETFYWFKHDYETIFRKNNFRLVEQGLITGTRQEWKLFKENK